MRILKIRGTHKVLYIYTVKNGFKNIQQWNGFVALYV